LRIEDCGIDGHWIGLGITYFHEERR
jgi:hypothetical protein